MGNSVATKVAPVVAVSDKACHGATSGKCGLTQGLPEISKSQLSKSFKNTRNGIHFEFAIDVEKKWKITEIKRAQNPLNGDSDWMYLHGYIVLKFEHAEEVKYCRIDWGTDGVYHEIGDKEEELLEYVGGLEKKIEAGIFSRVAVLGGMVMSFSAFMASITKSLNMVGNWPLSPGMVGGGCAAFYGTTAVVIAGIQELRGKEIAIFERFEKAAKGRWEAVPNPEEALEKLILHLTQKAEDTPMYDFGFYNCNHFANELRKLLLDV